MKFFKECKLLSIDWPYGLTILRIWARSISYSFDRDLLEYVFIDILSLFFTEIEGLIVLLASYLFLGLPVPGRITSGLWVMYSFKQSSTNFSGLFVLYFGAAYFTNAANLESPSSSSWVIYLSGEMTADDK